MRGVKDSGEYPNLLRVLAESDGTITRAEIVDELYWLTHGHISAIMGDAVKRGHLVRTGRGTYRVVKP